jgi:hypothetical protein
LLFVTRTAVRSLCADGDSTRAVYACTDEPMHATWLLAIWLGTNDTPVTAPASRVRAAHGAEQVLQDAARSGTVQGLLARLAVTDVIVYVEMTAAPDVPTARTKLVTATPSVRFLRIGINAAQPSPDWPSLLAHELQHAVEIAEHREVRDDPGVGGVRGGLGPHPGADSYETEAAGRVERLVRSELRR